MASQQLNIWVTTPDEKIMEFTLDANEPVEHLKALLEVEVHLSPIALLPAPVLRSASISPSCHSRSNGGAADGHRGERAAAGLRRSRAA
jgi:hypothetical protein